MGSRLSDGLAILKRRYVGELSPTLAEIHRDWVRFRTRGEVDAATRLQRAVHRLAGSGATFGFPSISAAAADLEERLDHAFGSDAALDGDAVEKIDQGLARLERAIRRTDRKDRPAATPHTSGQGAAPDCHG